MEHRGRYCKVDCLRRDWEEIFFTYIEDHPDVRDIWQEGSFCHSSNRFFKLIFKHNDKKRSLDIFLDGNQEMVPTLQQIFARSVIGDEIPISAPEDEVIYDLSDLMKPGFKFEHSADLGILDARVTKRRFLLTGDIMAPLPSRG